MWTPARIPAAVSLGRRGGKKKVPKGFSMMDQERHREIARKDAKKRWAHARKKKAKT